MIDTLIISGGSIKGINALGSLYYLYKNNYLENIITYIGTSVGCIICYLLIIGYTPLEILSYILDPNFLQEFNHINISDLMKCDGGYDYNVVNNHLKKLTFNKIGTYITMKDIKEYFKKRLICTTFNYSKKEIEYIDSDDVKYQDIPCLICLRMSSNLPLVFSKFKYNDSYYIDGGLVHNYPCLYPEKSLGIFLDTNRYIENESIFDYIYNVFHIPINRIYQLTPKPKINITIQNNTNILDMVLTTSSKLTLFSEGYYQTKNALNYIKINRDATERTKRIKEKIE